MDFNGFGNLMFKATRANLSPKEMSISGSFKTIMGAFESHANIEHELMALNRMMTYHDRKQWHDLDISKF